MSKRYFILSAVACMAMNVCPMSPFNGWWKGELQQVGLPLVMNIAGAEENDSTRISLYSPVQSLDPMPSERITVADDTLIVDFPVITANFIGSLNSDRSKIEGTFTQGGNSFALIMERSDSTAIQPARPQTPRPPFPYTTRDISFKNGDIELQGTLTLPSGAQKNLPVAIMITGSGTQNRDEEIAGHKPFAVIADALAKNGIATFRYDDRYYNMPGNITAATTTSDFAGDAMAALRAISDLPETDSRRIGFIGHSEGGLIAMMNAAEHPDSVAFIISIAGPAYKGIDLMTDQNSLISSAAGMPLNQQELDMVKEIFKVAASNLSTDEAKETIGLMLMTGGTSKISAGISSQLPVILSPWYREWLRTDPAKYLPKIKCSVMSISGAMDLQVPADKNQKELSKHIPEARIKTYPGLSHLLQPVRIPLEGLNPAMIETTIAPEVLTDIADYLKQILNLQQ